MKKTIKKLLVPHKGNKFHPHLLHPKRAVFYALFFLTIKAFLIVFVLLVPFYAYMSPDVLNEEGRQIFAETNKLRKEKGLAALSDQVKLDNSAWNKAKDMANHEYFSHVTPDGRTLADFLDKVNYSYRTAGENLAMGFSDANSTMDAWEKSPTHFANIIDRDYSELGVGLEAGKYAGEDTIFVVQHFGSPLKVVAKPLVRRAVAPASRTMPSKIAMVEAEKVTSTPAESVVEKPDYNYHVSKIYWLEDENGTSLEAQVRINGPVDSVNVKVGDYAFDLLPIGASSTLYAGSIKVPVAADTFFNPISFPEITIVSKGETYNFPLDWLNIKTEESSVLGSYLHARQVLVFAKNLFIASNAVYIGYIILFTAVLIVSIFELRHRHKHIIAQTTALIMLLVFLWRF